MTDVFTRLKELWEATTKGEWRYFGEALMGSVTIPGSELKCWGVGQQECNDAYFIAYAHNNVPAMLAEVERWQADALMYRNNWQVLEKENAGYRAGNLKLIGAGQLLQKENTSLKARLEKQERALELFFGRLNGTIESSIYDWEVKWARGVIEQANQILEGGDEKT